MEREIFKKTEGFVGAEDTKIKEDSMKNTDFLQNEMVLNECLQYALEEHNYEKIINRILSYTGKYFGGDRVYIFEINQNNTISNTYEWCKEGVVSQKDLFQDEPLATIKFWMEEFKKNKMVVLEDVGNIKYSDPLIYAVLKPQDIESLIVCSLKDNGEIIGFMGIDNPQPGFNAKIISFFKIIEHFLVSFLRKQEFFSRMEYITYHDQLTGALNRSGYHQKEQEICNATSVGILYGDINGLKKVNDQFGHLEGDVLICRCYELFGQIFSKDFIFRMGGDEFLVCSPENSREEFEQKCKDFSLLVEKSDCNIAVGFSWGNPKKNLAALLKTAEEEMYRNKLEYYKSIKEISEKFYNQTKSLKMDLYRNDEEESLMRTMEQYLKRNPEYSEFLISSVSSPNSTVGLYVGDLSSNVFYISDNLIEMFGFSGNIVKNLLDKWEERICYSEDREIFRKDFQNMKEKRQEKHDLRYRIYDKNGNQIWVHDVGWFKWNEEGTELLLLAGWISIQEFWVDPITCLPKENAALRQIKSIKEQGEDCVIFGIGFNYFAEINELKGRNTTDKLLQRINQRWNQVLLDKVRFYHLDGVRFLAVMDPKCKDSVESIVKEIREVIGYGFERFHVSMKSSSSICVLKSPAEEVLEDGIIEKVASFIEIAKQNFEDDFIYCTSEKKNSFKSQAEFLIGLNRDVQNQFQNFRVVVQPIVSTKEEKITGGEILIRWKHMGQDVSPRIFIPLLEKSGLICQVGRWVLKETIRNCQRIVKYNPNFQLSFNVSYLQISDEDFPKFIEQTLEKYRLSGSNLIMELTENHFDSEPKKLMRLIKRCEELGISIALDDFGSGYSSLSRLIKYPVSIVKLDRSLLSELLESEDRQNFLKSIVYACHQFHKLVCVEGVENLETLKIVNDTGCDRIQGYYYYRPLELQYFYEVLNLEEDAKNENQDKI